MESGRPQPIHVGAYRSQKAYSSGSHQKSEHARDPQSQTLRLPAAISIV